MSSPEPTAANPPASEAMLDVLVALLEDLHDPETIKPSRAVSMAALTICEEISARLRSIISKERNTSATDTASSAPNEPQQRTSAKASTPVEEDAVEDVARKLADAALSAPGQAVQSRNNRLSKRNRERLRRRQQAQQLGTWDDGSSMHDGERQSEAFRQSLWNAGWQMAPQVPDAMMGPLANGPAPSQAAFVSAMWGGGWQMVPVVTTPPPAHWVATGNPYQTSSSTELRPNPRRRSSSSEHASHERLLAFFVRALKHHRWQRLQRVWTASRRLAQESDYGTASSGS